MAISIKTSEDIEKMRVAGRLAAEVLEMIEPYVKPGVSTGELDRICNDYIVNEQKAISACLGYHGYPKSVCISVNEVVCHGIPDDGKLLKDGDIVNIDVTVIKDDFHGDTSKMFIVGKPTILGNACAASLRKACTGAENGEARHQPAHHRRGDPEICGSGRFLRGSRVLRARYRPRLP